MTINTNQPWISGHALLKRWNIDPQELLDLIVLEKLLVFEHSSAKIMDGMLPILFFDAGCYTADKIAGLYFRISDIEEMEIKNNLGSASQTTSEKKLQPNQIHKKAVRNVAGELWSTDPDITIADMILQDEINDVCDGRVYAEKTLRRWIRNLCPNRSPGRRPKKKN